MFSNPSCSARRKSMLGTRAPSGSEWRRDCSPASRGQGSPDLSQPGHPAPKPAAGCPASRGGSCHRSATYICSERELGLLVTPPESPAREPVPAFSESSAPGRTEAGGAARQATWQGLSFPVTPAPSLPGSVRGSCPQNPGPSILNLQISFIIRQGI